MRSRPSSIIEVRRETPTQTTLVLDWVVEASPGQFVMVWLPGIDEVPMGFSRLRPSASITVQRLGDATAALSDLEVGDRVGVRGPLGRGFSTVERRRCLLVGGGNGLAPLLPLADALVARGCQVDVAVGAKERAELLFVDDLEAVTGGRTHLATDDGSAGYHGFVSNLAEELMEELEPEMVYTCGPELMMAKVAASCWDSRIPLQASLERYMKCGIGICDACAAGPFLVCRDGPVFDGESAETALG